jgi:membrane-bound lytic murein transglycosylase B
MNGPLIDKLTNDGFDRAYLQKVFSDPRVKFLEKSLAINLINRDIKVDYSHFLNTTSINRAKRFLEKELSFLNKVEKQFKVEKEIVVSILLIESSLGKRTGKNIVFNVFTTLCAAAKPEVLKDTYQGFKKKYPHLTFEEIRKRAYKKSKWAYQELKHLFFIAKREKIDIFLIKGSWAGAFGAAQFLPSSYVRYALDGNNDQKVRLLNRYDSMVSVANYLKGNGWKKGLSDKRKKVLIRRYNNSTPYINAVLKLSQKIKN